MINWTVLVSGVFLISFSLAVKTENFKSALVFKIIPFFLGLADIFVFAVLMQWIAV
jgi:hypothetical protein